MGGHREYYLQAPKKPGFATVHLQSHLPQK